MYRIILFSFVALCITVHTWAQDVGDRGIELRALERDIKSGNKNTLLRLSEFMDSSIVVMDPLGYHPAQHTKAEIALRLIKENTFFLKEEIDLDDSSTVQHLKERLSSFGDKMVYNSQIQAFVITPLQNRNIKFEIRSSPKAWETEGADLKDSLLRIVWVPGESVKKMYDEHDPKIMAIIAQAMLRNRDTYNDYDFDVNRYTYMIALLTGTYIGVEGERDKIIYNFDHEYETKVRLNYAIYWLSHYNEYQWNSATRLFENRERKSQHFPNAYVWYKEMQQKDYDEKALNAFIKLTEVSEDTILKLNNEFNDMDGNYHLPTFYQQFLLQMSRLTTYCTTKNIDFKGSQALQQTLSVFLADSLPLSQRYVKENRLIANMVLRDVTPIEYWGMVHERSDAYSQSIGRILDKFYSKNWALIIADQKQLNLYLKKAFLYEKLGIIGANNSYLCKFTNADTTILHVLAELEKTTDDSDIKTSIRAVLKKTYWTDLEKRKNTEREFANKFKSKYNVGNRSEDIDKEPAVNNFEDTLYAITHANLAKDTVEKRVYDIANIASYNQLETAIRYIEMLRKNTIDEDRDEVCYHENNLIIQQFGIPVDAIKDTSALNTFLRNYRKMDRITLYDYYLEQLGIKIKNKDGALDYNKVYEILKYDMAISFVGSGGSYRDAIVFAMIKMLEDKFATKLGMPDKSEHCYGYTTATYTRTARDKWIAFLKEHKYIPMKDKEPPSFSDYKL